MRLPKKACSNSTLFFQQYRILLKIHLFFYLRFIRSYLPRFSGSFYRFLD
jgi:hypothetical protein